MNLQWAARCEKCQSGDKLKLTWSTHLCNKRNKAHTVYTYISAPASFQSIILLVATPQTVWLMSPDICVRCLWCLLVLPMIKPSRNDPATNTVHPIHRIKLFSLLILKSRRLPRSSTSHAAGHTAESSLFRKSTVGVWQSEWERGGEKERERWRGWVKSSTGIQWGRFGQYTWLFQRWFGTTQSSVKDQETTLSL